jgi:hypothetical protein
MVTSQPCESGSSETPENTPSTFRSVLFAAEHSGDDITAVEPDFFPDLNLDQLIRAVTAGRDAYDLVPFFYTPLDDVDAVRYRHEVMRDLEQPEALDTVSAFAAAMRRVREHLTQSATLRVHLQRQAWFVDAVQVYCAGVRALNDALAELPLTSRGLCGLREYVGKYISSDRFSALEVEHEAVTEAFAGLRYRVRIHGPRVTVARYEGEADYSVAVLDTFARFRHADAKKYLVSLPDGAEMNHVEAQILELVAKLHPVEFQTRADFCARHHDFLDRTLATFDREVQFYLSYLEMIGRLRAARLGFCYPEVSGQSTEIAASGAFDLALATKRSAQRQPVVTNDFSLQNGERILVVTGPNNGGKTTFARMFGQLHYLAALGLPVPGHAARLLLPDRIYTHFEREEDIRTLRGKLDDELVRVHQILGQATPCSVIVLNESFSSTTLSDATFVGTEVITRIIELGALAVYVTFVDEIASLGPETVSMVAQVAVDDPGVRTFKVLRQAANGLAYASAVAAKYGLTYERVIERISE